MVEIQTLGSHDPGLVTLSPKISSQVTAHTNASVFIFNIFTYTVFLWNSDYESMIPNLQYEVVFKIVIWMLNRLLLVFFLVYRDLGFCDGHFL